MKPNLFEKVTDKIVGRMDSVSGKLNEQFKGVKPFGSEEIPKDKLVEAYDQLGTLDMEYLVLKHGRDKVNNLISEIETYKVRKQNGRTL